ncbi:MAG: hypothetical protein HKO70_14435, partial [Acidimicrobiia bacterium]|nr:hypothetical protein [Acidimicrobiia bacterium]
LTNQTVTVYNATEDPGGDNKFDMLLAGIVGFDGFTVTANATAVWGYTNDIATIPLIISMCEFEKGFPDGPGGDATGASSPANLFDEPRLGPSMSNVAVEWLPDPYNNWPSAGWFSPGAYNPPATYPPPVTLTFHDASVTDDCAAQAGQDRDGDNRLPGGFGWLEVENQDECLAAVFGEIWASSDTGNGGPPPDCDPVLDQMLMGTSYGGVVAIPVYEDFWEGPANGSGPCGSSGKCYKIATHVAFHVVGYKLASGSNTTNILFDPPVPPPTKANGSPWPMNQWEQKFDCVPSTPGTDEVCLIGYFVDYVDNGGSGTTGGNSGIKIVKLVD